MTLAALSGATALWPVGAAAQVPRSLPGAVEPGRDRPLPAPRPESDFDFSIETPRRSPVPRAVDELRFPLKDIEIVGATRFPPGALRPLYQPLIGREVGLSDILAVADQIEAKYRQAGYIITRAYVPPQRVANGVFTINVVEGYVSGLAVEGGDSGVHDLIARYLEPVLAARPLDIGTMERALLLANDLPGVKASGLLRPSPDHPGASDLVVTITEAPWTGGLALDNRGSKFTGVWTLGGDVEWNSPLGHGDQLGAYVQMAPEDPGERIQGTLRYQHPIGTDGLTGSLSATASHGAPTAGLTQFGITTDSIAIGPRLSYPLMRSRSESLFIETGFTYQDATVEARNPTPTKISHDQWRVIDVAAIYSQNGFWNGSSAATFDIAQGLPILGATPNAKLQPDGTSELSRMGAHSSDFTKFTSTLRRIQVITGPFNVAITAQGQYALAPLVVGEQITFGGNQIGRGYEPSALSGDHGVGGSVEFRYDAVFDESFIQSMEPYVFFDGGKVWNRLGGNNSGLAVESTGIGVRVTLPHAITGGLELARTLKAMPGSDNGRLASKILVNAAVRF